MVRHDSPSGPGPTDLELEVSPPSRRRFTGAEWDRLVAIGFFGPEERLELLDGEVRVMSPIGDLHAVTVTKVTRSLDRALHDGFFTWSQNPLAVGEDRLYPDVVVLRGQPDDYAGRSPTPTDAAIVIEVADSTLTFDLGPKASVYASGGVREYWVVSLPDRAVIVHREPLKRRGRSPARFADVTTFTQGKLQAPGARRALPIASLLPTA